MLTPIAQAVIVLSGLYLVGLAALSLLAPDRAARFLRKFAASARAHYLELAARIAVGASILLCAPQLPFPGLFRIAGWVVVVTTFLLLAMPWRWHHWIAQRAVPYATRSMQGFGIASALLGTFLLGCVASAASV